VIEPNVAADLSAGESITYWLSMIYNSSADKSAATIGFKSVKIEKNDKQTALNVAL
jgi:hypothetical protein